MYGYSQLVTEYDRLYAMMQITNMSAVDQACDTIEKHLDVYRAENATSKVPAAWVGAVDYREDDCNQRKAIGQGDPWNVRSTHVPAGYGPWKSKAVADAFYLHYDHIDAEPPTPGHSWIMSYCSFCGERWNGFGVRNHGKHTGYLYGCTNIYTGGMYVADGQWSASAEDRRPGILPIMKRLFERHGDLLVPTVTSVAVQPPPQGRPVVVPAPQPSPPEFHHTGTFWVQEALNRLGQTPPLQIDGNYGRMTWRAVKAYQIARGLEPVDGVAGDITTARMDQDLAAAGIHLT